MRKPNKRVRELVLQALRARERIEELKGAFGVYDEAIRLLVESSPDREWNFEGHRIRLVDNFESNNLRWKPCAFRRFDLDVAFTPKPDKRAKRNV